MPVGRGIGARATWKAVRDPNGNVVTAAPAAWADGTAYQLDDSVTSGTKTFRCIRNHTAKTSGADMIPAPTATNSYWKETPAGMVLALSTWNLTGNTSQGTFQDLDFEEPRVISEQRGRTGQIMVGTLDLDGLQNDLLLDGYSGEMEIWPSGDPLVHTTGARIRKIAFNAEISNREEGGSEAVRTTTISFSVDGPVVRTIETVA